MSFCTNCGTEIKDGAKFCPKCGSPAPDLNSYARTPSTPVQTSPTYQGQPAAESNSQVFAIIAYITWIGLLVAALARDKNDEFVRFHVNQSLVIWLFGLIGIIPFLGWLWAIFIFICWLMGLIGACKREMKPVPLIGTLTIIKN